jgi:hypothetical protein
LASAATTALKRSSKSPRKRVPASSAVLLEQALGQAFGERGLTDAGFADEHRVVLAAAAEDLERALQLQRAADQRVELAGGGAGREVDGVGAERIARRAAAFLAAARRRRLLGVLVTGRRRGGDLRDAVADVVEHVEPRHALQVEQLRRERLGLLQHGREQVAGLHLGAVGALDVQDGRLQGAAEGQRLLRLLLAAAGELLDLLAQVAIELPPQRRQVAAARREDALAFGVVREHVEQVLERHVRVAARRGLAVGDTENQFDGVAEHKCLGFFHVGPEREPVFLRELVDAGHLGFGDVVRIEPAEPLALRMHVHHDAKRLGRRLVEQRFQHMDDEVHRRVIVVEQDHLEERRLLDVLARAFQDFVTVLRSRVGHVVGRRGAPVRV